MKKKKNRIGKSHGLSSRSTRKSSLKPRNSLCRFVSDLPSPKNTPAVALRPATPKDGPLLIVIELKASRAITQLPLLASFVGEKLSTVRRYVVRCKAMAFEAALRHIRSRTVAAETLAAALETVYDTVTASPAAARRFFELDCESSVLAALAKSAADPGSNYCILMTLNSVWRALGTVDMGGPAT